MTTETAPPQPDDTVSASGGEDGPPRAPFAVRRRHLVAGLAVVVAVLAGWAGHDVAGRVSSGGMVPPQAESLHAEQILGRDFGADTPDFVLLARAGGRHGATVDSKEAAAAGRALERRLAAERDVVRVRSYWTAGRPKALRSADRHSALLLAWFRGNDLATGKVAERVMPRVTGHRGPLQVAAGGDAAVRAEVARQASHDANLSELVALPVTATLLLLVFGSPAAAVLPVFVGIFAALGTTAVLRRLADVSEVSAYALNISTALAFGLAIDYCLFLISRYREERRGGAALAPALHTTLRTAGRAVAVSAATVAGGMAALLVFPHPVLRSIGCGGMAVTLMAALGSLVVLPAVLALLGDRLERFDVFARWRRHGGDGPDGRPAMGRWGRIARAMMRRPLLGGIPVACLLVLLAMPFTQARFGLFDDRVLPEHTAAGEVGTALRRDFATSGIGATTVVLPSFDPRARRAELDGYARRISGVRGVVQVDGPTGTYRGGRRSAKPTRASKQFASPHGVFLSVAGRGEPADPANAERVRRIRALPAPARAWVGGMGARVVDAQRPVQDRLPLALALIAAGMFALVLALTRYPVLALKALVLNALSLCATFGALVFVFQEGHLRRLVGDFTVTGSTDVLLPIVVFCIAFGLSMDYECILLSRIVEEHRRGAGTVLSVARGVDRTAGLFTWSALILAVVMAALATSGLVFLKAVGVGLALAALLDATVVRGLLVPAVMRLAGRANWWAPAWLRGGR
ncbi:MMPL family transporter [Streptomyces sp. ET3-23]|uniref:MMPL family transporter n=1 Tax=Streptomyces sp. ET3-23 TaxID=2885643 RepID=UPI001D10476C|nr:MMPL family transporter [Streptomyces sp. ET3-23]MCC2274211.1 MMPL family transporter [Streptomyces sp. ET3-23]